MLTAGATDAAEKELWLEKLDSAIVHTSDAAESEARLEEMFADAAKKDAQAQKMVRMKGGTMLISREAAAAAVAAAQSGGGGGGGSAASQAAAMTAAAQSQSLSQRQQDTAGRRGRSTARTADYDPTILPSSREVFDAIEKQEAKQKADADAARNKAVPMPRASQSQIDGGTMKRGAGAGGGSSASTSQSSTARPDGKYECETCGKRYPIADDLKYHTKLRHPEKLASLVIKETPTPVATPTAAPAATPAATATPATPAGASGNAVADAKKASRAVAMAAKQLVAKDAGDMQSRAPTAKTLVGSQKELRVALDKATAELPQHADALRNAGRSVQAAVVELVTALKTKIQANAPHDESLAELNKGGSKVAQAIVSLVGTLNRCN